MATSKVNNPINEDIDRLLEEKLTAMLAKAQQSADEIVKSAEAKAEKILEQAQAKATGKPIIPDSVKKIMAEDEELVEVRISKERGKGDVFVAVNGTGIQIQRGVPVKIKRKYAKVIWNSMQQDEDTIDLIEGLTSDWNNKVDKL